jgi:GNAT superfamily N-acetyltransferase
MRDGIEFDRDPARIDLDAVHAYLSGVSYWAKGRSREAVERSIHHSVAVVGSYDRDKQIGFARTVSDGVAIAYLADVYVLPEYQGGGIGAEMIAAMVGSGGRDRLLWMLRTADAHELYSRFGFKPAGSLVMERSPGGGRS